MIAVVGAMFVAMGSVSAQATHVVRFDDTDGVVQAGDDVMVKLVASSDANVLYADAVPVEVDRWVARGLVFEAGGSVVSDGTNEEQTIVTTGADPGEYQVIAEVGTGATKQTYSATLEIGDPGTALGGVTLAVGKVGHDSATTAVLDNPSTQAYGETAPGDYAACNKADADDTTTDPHCIAVTVTVENSLGNSAKPGDITAIDIYAPLATIISSTATETDGSATVGTSNAAKFFVTKARPGTVSVQAFVRGTGFATSEPLTLMFTGAASSISVGDPSSPLSKTGTSYAVANAGADGVVGDNEGSNDDTTDKTGKGVANIEVNAVDASDNPAALTADVNVVVKDTNGQDVTGTKIMVAQRTKPGTLTRIVELTGANATPGTYTATISLGTSKHEVEVVVAGDPAIVTVEAEPAEVAVGEFVVVTATVTDKDGNLQPDAGTVTFSALGTLKLDPLDDGDPDMTGAQRPLNDGVATVEYYVASGSGEAAVLARIGSVRGTTTVSTAPVEEEAMPEEEASVACLSNLAGFATWACGVESSASEIFGLVSGRGATALHLWNGSAWVRYSVVDGTMVPGSSDFMVAENDILYISN